MPYRIRHAVDADATQIVDIYRASRIQFLAYAPLAHTDDEIAAYFSGMLIPGGGVQVIENDDNILGFIALSEIAGVRWIDQLYLAPAVTGIGVGSYLLEQILQQIEKPVRLFCFQQNEGARRFYRRFGFQEVAYGDGSDNEENTPDVLMELTD